MREAQAVILEIEQLMVSALDNAQMERLQAVLRHCLFDAELLPLGGADAVGNEGLLGMFLRAKRLEGCSERTIRYYEATLARFLAALGDESVKRATTDTLRSYLADYQGRGSVSRVTVDNVRRLLSSFFSWLEEEDHILKSPVRRIKKIRSAQPVKETLSDEALEALRDGWATRRSTPPCSTPWWTSAT